jgi:hypothetical protein
MSIYVYDRNRPLASILRQKDGGVCCMRFIVCLMFDVYGIEIAGTHFHDQDRIYTEYLNTEPKNRIEQEALHGIIAGH